MSETAQNEGAPAFQAPPAAPFTPGTGLAGFLQAAQQNTINALHEELLDTQEQNDELAADNKQLRRTATILGRVVGLGLAWLLIDYVLAD